MTKEEKLNFIQKFSEEELTKKILIPLFEKMGFKNVEYTHTHGILEFGKDVIYCEEDKFGNRIYVGVQVKKEEINTILADKLLNQVFKAFGEPFIDLYDGERRTLDRFVIITSNKFTIKAKISLWAGLRGANLDKLTTFIDGNKLISLLESYLPSFFFEEYRYPSKEYSVILEKFKKMLNDPLLYEEDFKQFFIQNPWLLGVGPQYKKLEVEQRAGANLQVDFLLKTPDDFYDIMELKRHTDPVIVGGEYNWKLSAKCEEGISQLYRYIEYYEQNLAKEHYERGIEPYKPHGFLIIGRTKNVGMRRKLRSINSRYHLIQILTYDDIYEKIKRLINFKARS